MTSISQPPLDSPPEPPVFDSSNQKNVLAGAMGKPAEHELTRAGVAPQPRLVLMTTIGSMWGFAIGSYLGGKQTAFQYLAENAHKLPTTVQGWYFYHRTKNYKVILGGVKRGAKMAIPTGAICLTYGAIEAGIDDIRKEADVFNSVAAGMGTGFLFSAMTKLSRNSLKRSVMVGIYGGLVAGGLNDLHRTISGDTPSYIKWLKGEIGDDP